MRNEPRANGGRPPGARHGEQMRIEQVRIPSLVMSASASTLGCEVSNHRDRGLPGDDDPIAGGSSDDAVVERPLHDDRHGGIAGHHQHGADGRRAEGRHVDVVGTA